MFGLTKEELREGNLAAGSTLERFSSPSSCGPSSD